MANNVVVVFSQGHRGAATQLRGFLQQRRRQGFESPAPRILGREARHCCHTPHSRALHFKRQPNGKNVIGIILLKLFNDLFKAGSHNTANML